MTLCRSIYKKWFTIVCQVAHDNAPPSLKTSVHFVKATDLASAIQAAKMECRQWFGLRPRIEDIEAVAAFHGSQDDLISERRENVAMEPPRAVADFDFDINCE